MGNFKDLNNAEEEITKIEGVIEDRTLLARRDDFLAKTKLYQMKSKMRRDEYNELFNS
jgi:hypothetical protein